MQFLLEFLLKRIHKTYKINSNDFFAYDILLKKFNLNIQHLIFHTQMIFFVKDAGLIITAHLDFIKNV